MKFNIIFTLLLLFTFTLCFSQKVTKQCIDSMFKKSFPAFKEKRDVVYVLNGIAYDSLQINLELIDLTFLTCEQNEFTHCINDAGIIRFVHSQKARIKRKSWQTAKHLLTNKYVSPSLVIDNAVINQELVGKTFKELRLKNIMYIDIAQMNGSSQIRIWKSDTK
jgi:hypothetical protein